MTDQTILSVKDLHVEFRTDDGLVRAVNGMSFDLAKGETLGIVGESGSGKSVTNLALLGLIPQPPGKVTSGTAVFDGNDLLTMKASAMRRIRGKRIAMIFQDPMTALNPFLTVADQLTEVTQLHLGHDKKTAIKHAIEMLEKVGIPGASQRVNEYPHQFSGGMRQRVMIAMALSCQPEVLIADEPTTALDVTIQAQILDLLVDLQQTEGTAIILITHDLGVVASACQRVMVMYGGRVVEKATADDLFRRPLHPYTLGLLKSAPRLDELRSERLQAIEGQPPDMTQLPPGCPFEPRCPYRLDKCATNDPPLEPRPDAGSFACYADVESDQPREVAHD